MRGFPSQEDVFGWIFRQGFELDVLWGKFILLKQSGIGWFCQRAKVGDKGLSDFFIRWNLR
jgi:hypothetical protein